MQFWYKLRLSRETKRQASAGSSENLFRDKSEKEKQANHVRLNKARECGIITYKNRIKRDSKLGMAAVRYSKNEIGLHIFPVLRARFYWTSTAYSLQIKGTIIISQLPA